VQAAAPGCLAFFPDDPAGTPVTGKRAHPPAHRADRLFGRGRRDAACGLPAAQRPVAVRLARTAHGDPGTGHSRSCAARPPRVRRPLRQRV